MFWYNQPIEIGKQAIEILGKMHKCEFEF